jgi:hypothetical protein
MVEYTMAGKPDIMTTMLPETATVRDLVIAANQSGNPGDCAIYTNQFLGLD